MARNICFSRCDLCYDDFRSIVVIDELHKLVASDGAGSDQLGIFLAMDQNILVGGAFIDDSSKGIYIFFILYSCNCLMLLCGICYIKGAAYVFVTYDEGLTWSEKQKLIASDGLSADRFGYAVAVHAYTIVVGAYRDDDPGVGNNAGEIIFNW